MAKTDIEYAESFAKLIKCPTITESGAEYFEKFQEVLKQEFPLVFEKAEHFYPGVEQGDKESRAMIFHIKGKKNDRPIVLMAHQDVVPVDGEWKYAPFSGEIADGKVWGRGAMDCKNTLFITISAVEELLEEGFVPEQDVYLTYSDNEETSGPGADYFVNYFKANDIHPAIAVDEGGAIMYEAFPGMDKPFAMVGVIEKGYCDLKFVARSKGGHSSSPPKNTPFARLAAFMDYCENNKVFDRKLTAPAVAMLKG
ncbi:MAG: M20/M25/M40 family metallo-hydrolase, partial [Clostridia bacterium]|nr:M20/M25/M40 family metallo-hydrolase [Clostridia bacterium]